MKVRIKYTKSQNLKFIGHLDVMRFFQKAIKRANLDIAYSQGFSPHQLISFAAPLALGVTSEGEYFDAEFNTLISSDEFVKRLNNEMVEGMWVHDVVLLPDGAKNAMSIVLASDYHISFIESFPLELKLKMLDYANHLLKKESIEVLRKTKRSEKVEDIKPGIYQLYQDGEEIYMFLATGSEYNIKPDLILQAICQAIGISYNRFDYQIHRIETYTKDDEGNYISLLKTGSNI